MIKAIQPVDAVHARVHVPGSKSFTNRALVCAALASGVSTLRNASDSDDSALMANALNQLGVLVRRSGRDLSVEGTGGALFAPKLPLMVGNAGTTFRFLLSLSALARGRVVIEGSARMGERPIDDLLQALGGLGVTAKALPGAVRFEVEGGKLAGGGVRIKADKSSQFLSSLLMVAPYAAADVDISIEGHLTSASYLDMTMQTMAAFGVNVEKRSPGLVHVRAGQRYAATDYGIETDASGASYPFAAAAIAGGEVVVNGISCGSVQGDVRFLDVLTSMGCSVDVVDDGVRVRRSGTLRGVDVDMNSMPDVVPTLAVVALFAEGPTRISNVGHLRFKESDRLEALVTELMKTGARVSSGENGLLIHPAPLHGALLDTYEDHRLAMSFSLIGLRVPGIQVEDPACVRKSFPGYWQEFEKLSPPR
jgi:3-phosphoshikimate 1-carboxyvinyltransferase